MTLALEVEVTLAEASESLSLFRFKVRREDLIELLLF